MRAIVDTNVVAYYLLGTEPFFSETRAFWRQASQLWAPATLQAELANVLWVAARQGVLSQQEAAARLRFLRRLAIRSVPVSDLAQAALTLALARDLAVYDALFALLALRRELPLVTFDQRLLERVPERAVRPGALLGGTSAS